MYMEDELQKFIEDPFPKKSLTSIENQQIEVKVLKWANWSEGRGLVFWQQNPIHKQGIHGKV